MKRVTITIDTTSKAFKTYPELEVGYILEHLVSKLGIGVVFPQTLRDTHGNVCGTVVVESEPKQDVRD